MVFKEDSLDQFGVPTGIAELFKRAESKCPKAGIHCLKPHSDPLQEVFMTKVSYLHDHLRAAYPIGSVVQVLKSFLLECQPVAAMRWVAGVPESVDR